MLDQSETSLDDLIADAEAAGRRLSNLVQRNGYSSTRNASTAAMMTIVNLGSGMVTIGEVNSGKLEGGTCLCCGEPVVARKGQIVAHHFAHLSGGSTDRAFKSESDLHIRSKYLIAKHIAEYGLRSIVSRPDALVDLNAGDGEQGGLLRLYDHQTERARIAMLSADDMMDAYLPDHREAALECGTASGCITDVLASGDYGSDVVLEVVVTHYLSESKLSKLIAEGLTIVRIDVGDVDRLISDVDLITEIKSRAEMIHCAAYPFDGNDAEPVWFSPLHDFSYFECDYADADHTVMASLIDAHHNGTE